MIYIYTGAPDECSIHWPTKLINGRCPKCPPENYQHSVQHSTENQDIAITKRTGLPWSDPNSDPLGDIQELMDYFGHRRQLDQRTVTVHGDPITIPIFESMDDYKRRRRQELESLKEPYTGKALFPQEYPTKEELVAGVDYEVSVCPNCGNVDHTEAQMAECLDSIVGPPRNEDPDVFLDGLREL